MYFLDYYGPGELYQQVREPLRRELAKAFRAAADSACVRRVLEEVRRQGLKVVPQCSFVRAYMAKNPEFNELLH